MPNETDDGRRAPRTVSRRNLFKTGGWCRGRLLRSDTGGRERGRGRGAGAPRRGSNA